MIFSSPRIFGKTLFQTELYKNCRSVNSGSRKVKQVSPEEIRLVIGVILFMVIVKLPTRRMYWQEATHIPLISESITENRFSEMMSVICFNDNSIIDGNETNRIFKIQPLVDAPKHNFHSTVLPETCMETHSKDKIFCGDTFQRNKKKKKRKKWGYKLWVLAGVSGYTYNFEVDRSPESKGLPK